MSEDSKRPEIVTDEHLTYLDELRESGVMNMFGAGPHLSMAFGLSSKDARTVLMFWMKTFSSRHTE